MKKLTEEQVNIINYVKTYTGLLLIPALAGCAKSSTSRMLVDEISPTKGLYSAFNKMIILEGEDRFAGTNVESKTFHALAYRYKPVKSTIEPFTYLCIKEKLNYPIKLRVIDIMEKFFNSSSTDLEEFMCSNEETNVSQLAIKYIDLMVSGKIPITYGFMLKYLHLLLHQKIVVLNYDLVIFDEFQDTSKVSLEIFKLINSPKKIGLGDEFQTIYSFMNLANGFKELKDAYTLPLTKSFRVSTPIAERIEKYGKKYLSSSFTFTGTDEPIEDGLTVYITATNAQIVRRIHLLLKAGIRFSLTKPIKDIFACPLSLINAASGKKVFHKKYKYLEEEFNNFKYSNYKTYFKYLIHEVEDKEIHNAISLISHFRLENIDIWQILNKVKNMKKDKKVLVSTAHSVKGLEQSDVHIEEDLNALVLEAIKGKGSDIDTALKLGYVAASRARSRLHNCKFL